VLGLTITLLVTAGLAAAKGGKPPKPPPEPPGPTYTLIDLGHLGGGSSRARGINEAGQVGGNSKNANGEVQPVLVTPEDTDGDGKPDRWFRDDDSNGVNDLMIDLGLLGGGTLPDSEIEWFTGRAEDINEQGQVVGYSSINIPTQDELSHAFLWVEGEMIDLGVFETGRGTLGVAINNHGQIVGYQTYNNVAAGSFLILPDDRNGDGKPDLWFDDLDEDGVNDLMTTLGSQFNVRDINDAGQVLGSNGYPINRGLLLTPEDTNGDGTPDLWWRDENGDGLSDLLVELPPLDGGNTTVAGRLNASGQVAGMSAAGGKWTLWHAVLWGINLTPTDLGAPGKRANSEGTALNDQGDVAGLGGTAGDKEAMLWKDGKMYKLLDLLTNKEGIDSIDKVYDINNAGQIVGSTMRGEVAEAFVAIPTGN
jgi:probable HAF family extracellular repeat protein